MFICPICTKAFDTEEGIQQHFLICWKEHHSVHQSKSAHRSANVVTRNINNDIANFFNSLQEENNGRSIN